MQFLAENYKGDEIWWLYKDLKKTLAQAMYHKNEETGLEIIKYLQKDAPRNYTAAIYIFL
ncbi:MAG: hypothetical protein PHF29_08990 [Candidatus Riflebacteria bacterium]|nr:hypothetical protein [Candidatus Riflebacteria bacterium]